MPQTKRAALSRGGQLSVLGLGASAATPSHEPVGWLVGPLNASVGCNISQCSQQGFDPKP